jgi:hypothetical protein
MQSWPAPGPPPWWARATVDVTVDVMGAAPPPPPLVQSLSCTYYGWVVAAVLTGAQMVGHIGSVHLISLSIARIYSTFEDELGIPPDEAAVAWMAGCFLAAVFSPMYGRAIDIWGGKVCVPCALLIMSGGNAVLTFANERQSAPLIFACAVFMLRSAAMGALSPYTNTILSQWFFRKRGLAISVVEMVSMTGTTFVVAQLWQHGLDTVGWRRTHGFSGLCAALFALPAALLIYRTPESVGLRPDGDIISPQAAGADDGGDAQGQQEQEEGQGETTSLLGGDSASNGGSSSREAGSSGGDQVAGDGSGKGGGSGDGSDTATKGRPSSLYSEQSDDDRGGTGGGGGAAKRKAAAKGRDKAPPYNFTRREALRTPALYMLAIDKMCATTVGVSCGQLLLLTLRENDAVGVNIATHVMIPCGTHLSPAQPSPAQPSDLI